MSGVSFISIIVFIFIMAMAIGVGILLTALFRKIVHSFTGWEVKAFSKGLIKMYFITTVVNIIFSMAVKIFAVAIGVAVGSTLMGCVTAINVVLNIVIGVMICKWVDKAYKK